MNIYIEIDDYISLFNTDGLFDIDIRTAPFVATLVALIALRVAYRWFVVRRETRREDFANEQLAALLGVVSHNGNKDTH